MRIDGKGIAVAPDRVEVPLHLGEHDAARVEEIAVLAVARQRLP
jgi:hypothetical protein